MPGVLGTIGPTGLWLLYLWLGSAIAASWLSQRKGYGERIGLVSGVMFSAVAVLVWLAVPSRAGDDDDEG